MVWTDPKKFVRGANLRASRLNEQLRDNLNWLKNGNRSLVTVRDSVTDPSLTTAVVQPVEEDVFYVDISTTGKDVLFTWQVSYYDTVANATSGVNWYIKLVPLNGSTQETEIRDTETFDTCGFSNFRSQMFWYLWRELPAGDYRFFLMAKKNNASGSLNLNFTNSLAQFHAEEWGDGDRRSQDFDPVVWNDPKTWSSGLLTEEELTDEINQNLEYLRDKNIYFNEFSPDVTSQTGTDFTLTFNTFTLDSFTTYGGDLRFWWEAAVQYDTTVAKFEIRVNLEGGGSLFISSGDSSALSVVARRGSWYANASFHMSFVGTLQNIPAGTHEIIFTIRPTAGGIVTWNNPEAAKRFMVEEVGVLGYEKRWNEVRDWLNGEALTKGRLNSEIRDKFLHLKNSNMERSQVRFYDTLYGTASTSFLRHGFLTGGSKVNFRSHGNPLRITMVASHYTTLNQEYIYYDILIDEGTPDEMYLSSLLDTPSSDGIVNWRNINVFNQGMCSMWILNDLPEGAHTFEVVLKSSNASSAALVLPDNIFGLEIEELGAGG